MKRHSLSLFVILSLVASGLNYLTYPALSRILPAQQYIDTTVALSLLTQIGTFMSALTAVIIGLSKSKTGKTTIDALQADLIKIFILLGLVFLATSPVTMGLIQTPALYALPITLMVLTSIPVTTLSGYLNGVKRMTALGMVAAVTASMQLATGITISAISGDGVITMLCMALSQLLAIILLYTFFGEGKNHVLSQFSSFLPRTKFSPETTHILIYTAAAAICIMVLNLLQVVDLLILKGLSGQAAKTYTDAYVISRIVFFTGMIFIWPFLGEISFTDSNVNRRAFRKLLLIFLLIGAGAATIIALFEHPLLWLLFGVESNGNSMATILLLSVAYKLCILVVTASGLYSIVLRRSHIFMLTLLACIPVAAGAIAAREAGLSIGIAELAGGSAISALVSTLIFLRASRPLGNGKLGEY